VRPLAVILAALLPLLGCNAATEPSAPAATPSSVVSTTAPATSPAVTPGAPTTVTPLPTETPELPNLGGEVPDELLNDILGQVAAATGLATTELVVQRAQAVTWSDGSLGGPEPGMMYTQALVDGYWVVIEAGGDIYDFHASESGQLVLCPPERSNAPIEP
jgi:hypothetical protein